MNEPVRRMLVTCVGVLLSWQVAGCRAETDPALTADQHTHHHLHASDVAHEHTHEDFSAGAHTHDHEHPDDTTNVSETPPTAEP